MTLSLFKSERGNPQIGQVGPVDTPTLGQSPELVEYLSCEYHPFFLKNSRVMGLGSVADSPKATCLVGWTKTTKTEDRGLQPFQTCS